MWKENKSTEVRFRRKLLGMILLMNLLTIMSTNWENNLENNDTLKIIRFE